MFQNEPFDSMSVSFLAQNGYIFLLKKKQHIRFFFMLHKVWYTFSKSFFVGSWKEIK